MCSLGAECSSDADCKSTRKENLVSGEDIAPAFS